jgi:hypothetical protein
MTNVPLNLLSGLSQNLSILLLNILTEDDYTILSVELFHMLTALTLLKSGLKLLSFTKF